MFGSQRVYHSLPYPLRVLAASLYGYYLRGWRYGRDTEERVCQILERESWSEDKRKGWQEEQLARTLHRAATQVPYYRAYWQKRRQRGDKASYEQLENWPVLEKETLRKHPRAFIADDCSPGLMYQNTTSGTTGTPIQVWQSRDTVKEWFALFEARWRRWNGVSRHDKWANVGGQLVVNVEDRTPPFWVWNEGLNQLYMSSYHLAPDLIPAYLQALREYEIEYLWGYSSSLYALAREANKLGERIPMKVALTNAEPLMPHQKSEISKAFSCRVAETYGQAENIMAASECEAESLHLWPEVGILEVVDKEDQPVPDGETGEFLCTGLLNRETMFIRYRLGDRGARVSETCSCGRSLSLLQGIEGRTDDLLVTPDGRRIGRLDPVFKSDLPIREAQIIQDAVDSVRIRYVPEKGQSEVDVSELGYRLQDRMGADVNVTLEPAGSIPRTSNGKFRAVVNNIDEG